MDFESQMFSDKFDFFGESNLFYAMENIENESLSQKTDSFDFDFIEKKRLSEFEDNNNELIIPNESLSQENYNYNITQQNEEEQRESIITSTISNNENTVTKTSKKNTQSSKYNYENIKRKVKHILLECIINFLNKKLREIYNSKIGKGIVQKQFKTLNQREKSESNIQFNKDFLHKTIGEIFSEKISSRFTNYNPYHNKNLVNSLLNENNLSIQYYFKQLFSLTFFEYLENFRGSKIIPELKDMPSLDEVLENSSYDPDYIENLHYYFDKYEDITNKKRSRNSGKNKKNKK